MGGEEDESEDGDEDEEEDGNRLICLQTLEDTTAGYCFEIKLERHYEYESVVVISVSIKYENDEIGHLQGLVIDRNFRPRWQFHELCDAESQELQEMSVCFCNDDGSLATRTWMASPRSRTAPHRVVGSFRLSKCPSPRHTVVRTSAYVASNGCLSG